MNLTVLVGVLDLPAAFLDGGIGACPGGVGRVEAAIAGAERVFGIIDSEPEKDEGKITGRTIAGEIEFDDVSFSYDPTQKTPTIRNLSFRIFQICFQFA